MILERSSLLFFIVYKSSNIETKFKCRKMLKFKDIYVVRK